ncbi:hypothetical protein [Cryptosporangium sp. NPDC048952]|uniref:hypothetical protein n=1 Tax=Cryptosporangium sp. NPDC048952 TaxID=3363961 RepID=UPI00371561DF
MASSSGVRVTDETIKVRQVSHHQFSFVAGSNTESGLWTLQLVCDEGAWKRSPR